MDGQDGQDKSGKISLKWMIKRRLVNYLREAMKKINPQMAQICADDWGLLRNDMEGLRVGLMALATTARPHISLVQRPKWHRNKHDKG